MKIRNIFYSTFDTSLSATRLILVIQLLFTLLLPRVLHSIHSIHEHEAHECDGDNTHIHKIIHSCEVCDGFTQILVYNLNSDAIQWTQPDQHPFWLDCKHLHRDTILFHSDLRAPPVSI